MRALRLRRPHRIGIGALFAFHSPASAPSVGASGGAGWLALVDLVGSGDCLYTPTSYILHICKIFRKLKINSYVINKLFKLQILVVFVVKNYV